MIIRYRVYDAELGQIVLVRSIVTVPGHNIERRVILLRDKEFSKEFGYNLPFFIIGVFIPSLGSDKVAWVC